MPQVIVGRTDLISRKHAENGLNTAEISVLAPRPLNGMRQMNINYFRHISLNFQCKYIK